MGHGDIPEIPVEAYAERRARVRDAIGEGLAIVPGAGLRTRSNDVDHVFRQSSGLLYLCGWPQPDAIAVLSRERFVLFVQPRDPQAETWTGRRPGIEGAVERFGADEAHPIDEFAARLPDLMADKPRLYFPVGEDAKLDEQVIGALQKVRARVRTGVQAPREIVDPREILNEMRMRKEPCELEVMRAAADISREAHHEASKLCQPGAHEYELEATLDYVFRRRGAAGPAYPSIVGGGDNATILHYIENRDPLRAGELVLIDAGCELSGYASDVTRTYPVGGRFEGAAADVYAVVLQAQEAALAEARPGVTLPQIHDVAVRELCSGLVELGALEGDPEELMRSEAYRPFYMHSTSHWLGLDVHDVGDYRVNGVGGAGGKPRELEPGMVFTVEPGLYFGSAEEKTPESLRGIGVRIEDDVVVTDDGIEILTREIPKRPADVEAWMRD